MIRAIERFHLDEHGDWVAELSCLHAQHVRHQPPFQERPWVETEHGRSARIGSDIECPLCDRAELPDGLHVVRTAGPFDAGTVPAALQREHRVAEHTWASVRVLAGTLGFSMATEPPLDLRLHAGQTQPIPPGVPHAIHPEVGVRLAVDFLVAEE